MSQEEGSSALDAIQKSWDLEYPPAKVWRALTEPELIGQWLMKADFAPALGRAVEFRQEASQWWDGIVRGEVTELEPGRLLAYTWKARGLDTRVTWTLTPTEKGTRLDLRHEGFSEAPGGSQAHAGALSGWERNVGHRMVALLDSEI